ncbi:MAG TPA: HEAT repeat domain-containing protein [Kofleriaceae bacterium]|nr:HEAT repeat domain-containing protein [Kofleriaceae bacterium]
MKLFTQTAIVLALALGVTQASGTSPGASAGSADGPVADGPVAAGPGTDSGPGIAPAEPPIPEDLLLLLGSIEALPTREQLETLLPDAPASRLMQITSSASNTLSPGVRIRAIRALGQLPGSPQLRAALLQLLTHHSAAREGTAVLYLMTAVETLGQVGTVDEVDEVAAFLAHPSRDVRIFAARALRQIAAPSAVAPLREQASRELVEAVKIEISETLQILAPQGR